MANYGEKTSRRKATSGRTGEDPHRGRKKGSLGLLKTKPKTTLFRGSLFYYFFKRHVQNDIVLGFQQPKQRRFVCLNSKPFKNPSLSYCTLKPSKKTPQIHFQSWIEEEIRRRRLKEVFFFFFHFSFFVETKTLKKSRETFS